MAFYTGKSSSYVKDRFNLAPLDITAEHIKGEVLYYFLYGMLPDPKHHISRHESLMALDKEVDTPSNIQ